MTTKTIQGAAMPWMLLIIFPMLSLGSTEVFAGEAGVGDSPQAVYKAAQAAGEKMDYGALVMLVAPSERVMLAFGTDMGVGMFIEFFEGEKAVELKKKYQQIQKKFGIEDKDDDEGETLHITQETPQEVIDAHVRKRADRLYGHVDAAKYVPALMAIVINLPEMAEQATFLEAELTDLMVDGDRATGRSGEKTVKFMREGGRWYLTSDVMN